VVNDLPVYRIVDGELIRIRGDEKHPQRTYMRRTDSAGMYYLEISDEAEKDIGKGTIPDGPKPSLTDPPERRSDVLRQFADGLKFENRLVAFLDILGWRQAVERSASKPEVARQLGMILGSAISHSEHTISFLDHAAPRLTHFSDSILVSLAAGSANRFALEFYLHGLLWTLTNCWFLVRGGITEGPIIHRESMAFGPALNRAYDLERSTAKMPRIVVDPRFADEWAKGVTISRLDDQPMQDTQRRGFTVWRRDDDGQVFFDFLAPFYIPEGDQQVGHLVQKLTPARKLFTAGIEAFRNDPDKFAKYIWAARYFNQTCAEYAVGQIEPISVESA